MATEATPRLAPLPRLVGHRGLAAHAPENTLAGIRMAAARGVSCVEFDAKLTGDGVVILMHDDRLDRTTDGVGPVASLNFDEIRRLDAGAWFDPRFAGEPVPTLTEALDLLVELDMGCNVEIKACPGREMETAGVVGETIRHRWPSDRGRLIVSSFARASMARLRDIAPELPRGLLVWDRTGAMLDDAAQLGCVGIHCAHQHLSEADARAVKDAGYNLAVYTVNDPADAQRLIRWGCDTIISDTDGALGESSGDRRAPADEASGSAPGSLSAARSAVDQGAIPAA